MNGFAWDNDNDYIVPEVDELAIFNNIAADIKNKFDYHLRHDQLSYDRNILNKMMEELN